MIRGLKRRKVGASGAAYSAVGLGHSIKLAVMEHGYQVKVQCDLNYNAMTEKQAQKAHDVLFAAMTEALTEANTRRRSNVGLFGLDELEFKDGAPEGINER
jgi:hypothetical protein